MIKVLITGANKGIGFSIIDALASAKHPTTNKGYHFILGSRDMQRGMDALNKLRLTHPESQITLSKVDMLDRENLMDCASIIKDEFGEIDILINNAGVNFAHLPFSKENFKKEMDTNFNNARFFTEHLLSKDLIAEKGKIINTASELGKFFFIKERTPSLYAQLSEFKKWSEDELTTWANRYEKEFVDPSTRGLWQEDVYMATKMFLIMWTWIVASSNKKVVSSSIQCYSFSPGYCQTDIAFPMIEKGASPPKKSPETGAKTAVRLIEMPFEIMPEYQGGFFYEEKLDDIEGGFQWD